MVHDARNIAAERVSEGGAGGKALTGEAASRVEEARHKALPQRAGSRRVSEARGGLPGVADAPEAGVRNARTPVARVGEARVPVTRVDVARVPVPGVEVARVPDAGVEDAGVKGAGV